MIFIVSENVTSYYIDDRSRLLGEEVIPQIMNENTVTFLNTLLGVTYREVMSNLDDSSQQPFGFIPYTRMTLVPLSEGDEDSLVGVQVAYSGPAAAGEEQGEGGAVRVFSIPALLGMYLASLAQQVYASYGDHNGHAHTTAASFMLSFPLPHNHTPEAARALTEACAIAGIAPAATHVTTTTASLARAYSRKLMGLKAHEKSHLEVQCDV